MQKGLVSVIIPSYGGGQYLKRAVDSVIAQTYDNIEIIVVDDNGLNTPNQLSTAKVMEQYVENSKVKYICHKVNINGSAARNTGVRNSDGEFIALLDDDDEYLDEKISRQINDIHQLDESYALVFCDMAQYRDGNKVRETHRKFDGYGFYELMTHSIVIGSSSLLIKRSVWEELNGFDETFKRHQDFEFTARVAFKYKVKSEEFVGLKYHMEFRNSPKNADIAYQYRKHYLDKMKPYYITLSKEQQRQIEMSNLMDIVIQYMKEMDLGKAASLYKEINPGFYGVKYISRRLIYTIKKKLHL